MSEQKNTLAKSYIIALLMLLGALAIVFRLINLQSTQVDKYKKVAAKTNFRQVEIPAARGNIYSSDGVLLATNIVRYDVHMDLVTVRQSDWDEYITAFSDSIASIWKTTPTRARLKLERARKSGNQYFPIVKDINHEQFLAIKKFPLFEKGQMRGGFIVERDIVRIKPSEDFGPRTIGFSNERGNVGLEGAFNSYLKGTNGKQYEQFINGKYWKPLNYLSSTNIAPQDGYDVFTTINSRIQDITNSALEKQIVNFEADHGTAIVMEVKSGRILAMSNLKRMPDGTCEDVYNYAVGERTEPGSTFKVISLLAALDDGYIDPNTKVNIGNGTWRVNGKTVVDDHGSGELTITQVLSESSNVGTAKTIYKYYHNNPENFVDKIEKWGVTKKVGIDIKGEPEPVIPNPDGENWSPIALPWMSYGYGVALSPIQILNFYNAIANDGVMVKPRLIEKIESEGVVIDSFETVVTNKNIASKSARDLMENMLVQAVENGTAESIFTPNLKMAGKTGTAQYEYWKWKNGERKYQASFCGYFPADNPKYSCIVIINQPKTSIGFYGSQVAAPVFKEIAGKVFLKTPLNIPEESTAKAEKNIHQQFVVRPTVTSVKNNVVPNLIGKYGVDVIPTLENAGFKVKYRGVGKVKSQSISAGTKVKPGATIYLILD